MSGQDSSHGGTKTVVGYFVFVKYHLDFNYVVKRKHSAYINTHIWYRPDLQIKYSKKNNKKNLYLNSIQFIFINPPI